MISFEHKEQGVQLQTRNGAASKHANTIETTEIGQAGHTAHAKDRLLTCWCP